MKTKAIPFRKRNPRQTATIEVRCYADPMLFKRWEEMSDAAKNEFEVNGPIPCEGGGVPGEWCDWCRFGELVRLEND